MRTANRRVVLVANDESRFVVADGVASFRGADIVTVASGTGLGRFVFEARTRRTFPCFGPAVRAAARVANDMGTTVHIGTDQKPLPAKGPIAIIGSPRVYLSEAEGDGWDVCVFPPVWGFHRDQAFVGAGCRRLAEKHGQETVALFANYAAAKLAHRDKMRALSNREREALRVGDGR